MNEVYIVAAKRTPIGGFLGNLSHLSATELGTIAVKEAQQQSGLDITAADSIYFGNVLSANEGQSPARQVGIYSGLRLDADATTINKVCASGMKAAIIGAQQIQLGIDNVVVTGGMESMSNTPHYAMMRKGNKLGDITFTDGILKDGLMDVYNHFHMGNAAELCARKYGITREMQDEYAIASYGRAVAATAAGKFKNEIAAVTIESKGKQTIITDDEDIYKLIPEKVAKLKPAFEEGGTVTAANASNINDGAAALILASAKAVNDYGLKPLAKIVAYADAAQAPEWFTTSPSVSIPKALKIAGLSLNDIDYFEINEAYAAVILANQQILGFDQKKVNVYGGAVAMGHPIGASGARIITTLISVLKQEGGRYGLASICNGGGGSSTIIIENL